MRSIDKHALFQSLLGRLNEELARVRAQAQDAAEGATHEENRAESDKDMRSTEASYVARGYADRAAKIEQTLISLSRMELKRFERGSSIEASALVELRQGGKTTHYFVVVAAGGEHFALDGLKIQTLTTTSPLGAALLGLNVGDEAEVSSPQGSRIYEIVDIA
jgi:transcription elongation GreA/GreB family factor